MAEELAINGGPRTTEESFPSTGNASGRDLGEEEIALVSEVIRSGRMFRYSGSMVGQFEKEYAEHLGIEHVLAVTSGTASLHTAVAALELNPGDEIITSPISDMGTYIGIVQSCCIPIFADCDPLTLNMNPESIEKQITDRTRAILVVHLFGQPCRMDEIMDIAKRHALYVIEDCAQAHGATYDGQQVGTFGDIGCFSLQQSKQITAGDGGIIATAREEFHARARDFHDKYYDRTGRSQDRSGVARIGINYRMNEVTGAVALAQTRKLKSILERRRASAERLVELIEQIDGINGPYIYPKTTDHSWWRFTFSIDQEALGVDNETFARAIRAEGLPFGLGYVGNLMVGTKCIVDHVAYGDSEFPWEPPYGRDPEYDEADYPGAAWGESNLFTHAWTEGHTVEHAELIAQGLRKVADYYRSKK
jgi:perosamine synthetase